MSKKQQLSKHKKKQSNKKQRPLSTDEKLKNFVEPLAKSPSAAKAFRMALEKTTKK
jgi:hypothetical protein